MQVTAYGQSRFGQVWSFQITEQNALGYQAHRPNCGQNSHWAEHEELHCLCAVLIYILHDYTETPNFCNKFQWRESKNWCIDIWERKFASSINCYLYYLTILVKNGGLVDDLMQLELFKLYKAWQNSKVLMIIPIFHIKIKWDQPWRVTKVESSTLLFNNNFTI